MKSPMRFLFGMILLGCFCETPVHGMFRIVEEAKRKQRKDVNTLVLDGRLLEERKKKKLKKKVKKGFEWRSKIFEFKKDLPEIKRLYVISDVPVELEIKYVQAGQPTVSVIYDETVYYNLSNNRGFVTLNFKKMSYDQSKKILITCTVLSEQCTKLYLDGFIHCLITGQVSLDDVEIHARKALIDYQE